MNFEPIKSGNLTHAAYDAATKKAQVKFKNGGHYEYEQVAPEEYAAFQSTFQSDDSSGGHFHRFIKNKPFRKL